jgi:hypothetical protein
MPDGDRRRAARWRSDSTSGLPDRFDRQHACGARWRHADVRRSSGCHRPGFVHRFNRRSARCEDGRFNGAWRDDCDGTSDRTDRVGSCEL